VNEKVKDTVPIDDANIVAYLVMKGYIAIPYIKTEATESQSSRVSWDVQGDTDAINTEVKMFWANERVGIRDYVRILKDIRSTMYTVKNMKGQLKEHN
jgi:hypothetical protein